MNRRITINVQPVENGYTISAQASDKDGRNAINRQLIAKDDAEVEAVISNFAAEAFKPAPAAAQP